MDVLEDIRERFRNYFPETIFEAGIVGQLEQVLEEVGEALDAVRDPEHLLVESCDIIQSVFTLLYKNYTDEQIREALGKVQGKNGDRGYYLDPRHNGSDNL